MILGVAPRRANYDDMIARTQGVALHTGVCELRSSAPLRRPSDRLPRGFFRLQLQERMRIAVQELHDVSLDRYSLISEVRRRKGVVCVNANVQHSHCREDKYE